MKNNNFEKLLLKRLSHNRSVIELCINSEQELYNGFSALRDKDISGNSNARINSEITRYLEAETQKIPIENGLILRIKTAEDTGCTTETVGRLIKTGVTEEITIIDKTARRISRSAVVLALIGMLLIGTTQVFHLTETRYSLNEFIIVASWVFMWKAVELWFFKRAELMREKTILTKIFFSEITAEP